MAPHPPPCNANEMLWGTLCYPKLDTLTITNLGGAFSFTMGNVSSDLLPELAHSAGGDAHMLVKKSGDAFDVTIGSVPSENAKALLKKLRPDEPKAQLPE